jgi:NAD(P)-dependent dehydrogenase (short-subunit alcohol dehydrogenase family)
VEAALAAGHNVVATARDPASLDDLASRFPDRLLAQRLDVTDEVRAQEVVAAAVERFGLIDVLVNNAGFSGVGSIEDMPLDLIEAQFDTNFHGRRPYREDIKYLLVAPIAIACEPTTSGWPGLRETLPDPARRSNGSEGMRIRALLNGVRYNLPQLRPAAAQCD